MWCWGLSEIQPVYFHWNSALSYQTGTVSFTPSLPNPHLPETISEGSVWEGSAVGSKSKSLYLVVRAAVGLCRGYFNFLGIILGFKYISATETAEWLRLIKMMYYHVHFLFWITELKKDTSTLYFDWVLNLTQRIEFCFLFHVMIWWNRNHFTVSHSMSNDYLKLQKIMTYCLAVFLFNRKPSVKLLLFEVHFSREWASIVWDKSSLAKSGCPTGMLTGHYSATMFSQKFSLTRPRQEDPGQQSTIFSCRGYGGCSTFLFELLKLKGPAVITAQTSCGYWHFWSWITPQTLYFLFSFPLASILLFTF